MNQLRSHSAIVALWLTNFWLLGTLTAIAQSPASISPQTLPANSTNQTFVDRGTEIFLNGKTINVAWAQWKVGDSVRLGISDTGLTQQMGVELFNNSNYSTQAIDWYGTSSVKQISVDTKLSRQYRYLDISTLAKNSGWQWQVVAGKLQLNTPATKILNVERQTQKW
jgi:hypothetical protein